MARVTIHWTETAIRQRNHVFEYWIGRNQSTTYAKKLNEKIKERTNLLKQNPELGTKTDYKNTRAVSLGHYSILYQINDLGIMITGFWDNRQDPEKLIKFLRSK